MTKSAAIDRALHYFDHERGGYFADLAALVANPCGVLPNGGGSNMTYILQYLVGMPCVWLPLSYAGCSQHAPNEHMLRLLMREGLRHVTGIYWDLGDPARDYRPS